MPKGIYKRTITHRKPCKETTKVKISKINKGKHFSPNTEFKKGMIYPERQNRVEIKCMTCDKLFWVKKSSEKKRKTCSKKCFAIYQGIKTKGKKIHTEEFKQRLRERNWRGGVTPINKLIRRSIDYKLWRESVFKRDNYQCIWGGKEHGNNLNADHIKPFALYPELRFAIDNGRTLCKDCHKKTNTYGWNYFNNKKI